MASGQKIPATMTAIAISEPGGPRVLKPETRDVPQPGPGEILIKVHAAGVNRPDVQQRKGAYPPPPGASDLPGLEASGEVAALGDEISRWRIGDRVCALTPGGGYAEYVKVHAGSVLPLPAGFTHTEAAAVPENYFTVWHNVFERGGLKKGETLLVHGGSSGIGTTAIQLAAAFGAYVVTTAGSKEKCDACLKLGADRAINYKREDFVAEITKVTGGRGVDVILDMVGAEYFARNLDLLAVEGRLVQIAVLRGAKAEINLARLLRQRLTVTGSTLRSRTVQEKGAIASAIERAVWPLIDAGKVAPVIYAVLPLTKAGDAHRILESGSHIGKVVLSVDHA